MRRLGWKARVTAGLVVGAALLGVACSRAALTSRGTGAPAKEGVIAGPAMTSAPPGERDLGGGSGAVAVDLPPVQQKIIKTAELSVSVRRGTFQQTLQRATLVAGRYGGYVATTQTSSTAHPSGVLVLRVPVASFESALGDLHALGTVRSQRVAGQDVTGAVVDLQARLANWQAQEAVLLRLMARSTSISDSLKVQQSLQDVQLNIEEIQGQLRAIGDQTDYSTITLSMAESTPVVRPPHRGAFGRALRDALHGMATVATAVVVAVGYLIPFAALGLIGLLGWAIVRRTRARPAAGSAPGAA